MDPQRLAQVRKIVKAKPYILWGTKDYDTLSAESVLAAVISFGDWEDFLKFNEIYGEEETQRLYIKIKGQKRKSLRDDTISLFDNYFKNHA